MTDDTDAPVANVFRAASPVDPLQELNSAGGRGIKSPAAKAAFNYLVSKGRSPIEASGMVGNLFSESAGLNPREVHDGGIGLGIAGWNGQRLNGPNGLYAFAQQRGMDPHSRQAQLDFYDHEFNTTERSSGDMLRAAKTPSDAGRAGLFMERPANYNLPGAHPERAQRAEQAYALYGTDASPTAGFTDIDKGVNPQPTAVASAPQQSAAPTQTSAGATIDPTLLADPSAGPSPLGAMFAGMAKAMQPQHPVQIAQAEPVAKRRAPPPMVAAPFSPAAPDYLG